ncbi:MAG: TetR family transcriptional regulator C-terminal domain-containing protein [Oscillospiraceae bacterium]|nr:TetR family transcriptional regulator C-terminal domain-containing protein [Oscillospiraceae bacterium]
MNTANNQLHQETERRLRQELLGFLEREQEPTVGQLCKAAQINRSTFYRHYRDIPDLMEKTEKDIQKGLFRTVGGQGDFLQRLESSSDALEPLISYIGENRHFYRAYLRKNGGAALEDGYQLLWEKKIQPLFLTHRVESEARMRYYFTYAKSGFVTVLRMWLEGGCRESPRELAGIIHKMLPTK